MRVSIDGVGLRGFGAAGDRIQDFEEVALVHLDALRQTALRLTGSRVEADEVLGCPIGTVMSRLSRGRRLLRASLTRFARERGYVKEDEP